MTKKAIQLQNTTHNGSVRPLWMIACVMLFLAVATYLAKDTITTYMLWQKGNTAFNDQDFGQAEIFYSRAMNRAPGDRHIQYNLGNAYYAQGRYAEAITVYNAALKGRDADELPEIWNNLGNAYFMAGDLISSANAYGKALSIDDNQATRQNFVYVTNKLHDQTQSKFINQVKKEANEQADKQANENKDKSGEGENGEKDPSPQRSNLSSKTVEDLFGQIDRNEDKVMGRISNVKRKNDLPANALDY